MYPVNVKEEAWDRVGLMRDVTTVVAEEKVNITSVNLAKHDDLTVSILLTLETKGLVQLSRLLTRIDSAKGVIGVTRIEGEVTKKSSVKADNGRVEQPVTEGSQGKLKSEQGS